MPLLSSVKEINANFTRPMAFPFHTDFDSIFLLPLLSNIRVKLDDTFNIELSFVIRNSFNAICWYKMYELIYYHSISFHYWKFFIYLNPFTSFLQCTETIHSNSSLSCMTEQLSHMDMLTLCLKKLEDLLTQWTEMKYCKLSPWIILAILRGLGKKKK